MSDYLKELFIDEVKNLGRGGSGSGGASGGWKLLTEFEVGTSITTRVDVDLSTYECNEFFFVGEVPGMTDMAINFNIDIGGMGKGLTFSAKNNPNKMYAHIFKDGNEFKGFAGKSDGWSAFIAYGIGSTPRGTEADNKKLNLYCYPYTETEYVALCKLYGR